MSFLGFGSKFFSISEDSPQGEHPVFRATSPLSRGHLKHKGLIHNCAGRTRLHPFFAQFFCKMSFVFAEQVVGAKCDQDGSSSEL